jgi:hypothetical protein
MTPRPVALALAGALAALAPVLSGCAEDDYGREAAYPSQVGVVGTTTPSASPAVQVAPADTPAVQQPAAEGQVAPAQDQPVDADDYADTDPAALSDFRSTLDPYGTWVDDGTYGTVWVPSESVVGSDFEPYVSAGHWAYDDDYVWVSDYDWGWAPFHYGRWVYAAPYGWEWVPGRVYAGAWVSWRYGWGDWGYVGWAPLGPTWGWWGGVAIGLGFVPVAPYGFCASGELFSGHPGPHMVSGPSVNTVASHTVPYVPARPTVNGRVAANPRVSGPAPQVLGIPPSSLVRSSGNRGVEQARAFAHASTATPMGARAPQALASRAPGAGRAPSYGSSAVSHFGGKLGSGFRGDVASARPTYGPSYGPTRPGAYGGGRPTWSGSGYGYSGMRSGWGSYSGSPYRGGGSTFGGGFHPGVGVAPSTSGHRGGGSSGDGGYSGGQHGYSGFHGGGGGHAGGFSGFSGGGGHFGGGGGGHGGGHR